MTTQIVDAAERCFESIGVARRAHETNLSLLAYEEIDADHAEDVVLYLMQEDVTRVENGKIVCWHEYFDQQYAADPVIASMRSSS